MIIISIFNNEIFYKHPNELIDKGAGINYIYALLNEFSTNEGYIYNNPLFLIMSCTNIGKAKLNGRDLSKLKGYFQYLLDNNYIQIYTMTEEGLSNTETFSFLEEENKKAIKVTDNICVKLSALDYAEGFTKSYLADIEKLNRLTIGDASKLFLVYISIMKYSYGRDVIEVSFSEIKKIGGIKSNSSISRSVGLLKEYQILNKTNSIKGNMEGTYNYVRFHNSHLLGSEKELLEKEKERQGRNFKRKYTTFAFEQSENFFGSDDNVEPFKEEGTLTSNTVTTETEAQEKYAGDYPYKFEVYNHNCPANSYLAVHKDHIDVYCNNSRSGGGDYRDIIKLLTDSKVLNNQNSIINKMGKDAGAINIVLKDSKADAFLNLLSTEKILKNVV